MKNPIPAILALFVMLLAVMSAPGCTRVEKTATGWRYNNGLFSKRAQLIEIEGNTNAYRVRVKGYQSDADAIVDLAREAIALGKAATPAP